MTDVFAPIELTRQELCVKIWKVPMRNLAQEFGLSDVGLAKICKRRNIPIRGHTSSDFHRDLGVRSARLGNDAGFFGPAHTMVHR